MKKEYDDVCLVIIDDGVLKNQLEETCIKEHVRDTHFTENKNQAELPKYYSIADLFVLPALEDTWGLVINEAMCCILPVITTRATGASEMIVPGKNSFIKNHCWVPVSSTGGRKTVNSPKANFKGFPNNSSLPK